MKLTNQYNLPQPFVDAVESEYRYKDKQYSVTALLKGACQTILERRHQDEIIQDVSDMVWMIFGSAIHSILENSQETNDQLKENYLVIDVGDHKLSGIFDLYDAKEKTVTDYKSGTVWKVQFNEWEDYRKQLLMYAYMLRKIGFECNKGQIVMMLKDHSKSKANTDMSYPQHPVYIKKFEFNEEDFAEIEKFIQGRFNLISILETMPDEKLTPCEPEERWHRDDKYAVMREGRKTAIKLFDNVEEAEKMVSELGAKHYVELREGSDARCEQYCNVTQWCPFYKAKRANYKVKNADK